jgi:hypothetical protein
MAVVNVKSAVITNLDAVPAVKPAVEDMRGRLKVIPFTVEIANGDSIASTYRVARVHSDHRILSIRKFSDAVTGAIADVGLYRTNADGGAVVLATAYGSAVSLVAADVIGAELAFEQRDIVNIMKYVWGDAGLTADPNLDYDVTFTLTAAATAAGTLSGYIVLEDRT